jgi:hypothetical protein
MNQREPVFESGGVYSHDEEVPRNKPVYQSDRVFVHGELRQKEPNFQPSVGMFGHRKMPQNQEPAGVHGHGRLHQESKMKHTKHQGSECSF